MRIPILLLSALLGVGPVSAAERSEVSACARRIASEGVVLLENKAGALPLKADEPVVLAGVAGYRCFRMGWGSGDMPGRPPVEYDRGLEKAGVRLDADFAKLYRAFVGDPSRADVYDRVNRDPRSRTGRFDEPEISETAFAELAEGKRARKCVVAIGRRAGESEDLGDVRGGFRLHLQEERLLRLACAHFDTVIVLLNAPGVMDVSFMDRYPVKALVFTSYLGEVSGDAVADVLTGRVSPSGKTVDTWAKAYRFYPTTDCFGTLDVPYNEWCPTYGLFADDLEQVRYPFGFGLSYTTFAFGPGRLEKGDGGWKVTVPVTNSGRAAGAEVVQAYVDRSEQRSSSRSLCAFARTKVLRPGESEEVALSFDRRDIARFFHTGDTTSGEAVWQVSKGYYTVFAGNSATGAVAVGVFEIRDDVVVQKVRERFDGEDHAQPRSELEKKAEGLVTFGDVVARKATLDDLVAQFTDEELVAVINGRLFEDPSGPIAREEDDCWSGEKYGIPSVAVAYGSSGVRRRDGADGAAFAWPCATALAQTWDLAAAEAMGRWIAEDMKTASVDCWLAPGVNIHRNPLCGRNFERFSEDPLLAGRMGAAVIRGVQLKADGTPSGRLAALRHFCADNQEFCRDEVNSLMLSEKSFREIYLKPFEIAVSCGKPLVVVTGRNRINDEYAATNHDLLTGVLREEWWFDGLVMSASGGAADRLRRPSAGSDAAFPFDRGSCAAMLAALGDGRLKRADVQRAAVNALKAALVIATTRQR